MECENNYYCKCEKCEESKNNIGCPFCGAKPKYWNVKIKEMTLKHIGEICDLILGGLKNADKKHDLTKMSK